jgi:hypothetical protein
VTDKEISALYKKTSATGKNWKFQEGQKLPLTHTSECGKFHGKAGTIKRSRKGSVTRLPNGKRWYPHPDSDYGTYVTAYLYHP